MDKTFSRSAFQGYIKKLHLTPGDVLIVSNQEILRQLQQMPSMNFVVPVLFSPDGKGLASATREQLVEAIERIDEAVAVHEGIA